VKVSIGRLLILFSNKIIGRATGGVNRALPEHASGKEERGPGKETAGFVLLALQAKNCHSRRTIFTTARRPAKTERLPLQNFKYLWLVLKYCSTYEPMRPKPRLDSLHFGEILRSVEALVGWGRRFRPPPFQWPNIEENWRISTRTTPGYSSPGDCGITSSRQ
jgi:hypothetical protein